MTLPRRDDEPLRAGVSRPRWNGGLATGYLLIFGQCQKSSRHCNAGWVWKAKSSCSNYWVWIAAWLDRITSARNPSGSPDGSYFTTWGEHRKQVANAFSTYEEYASHPLAQAKSVAEIEAWPHWPKTEYWDWASVASKVQALDRQDRYHIRYEVGGIFKSAWALYGLENFLVDLIDHPEIPCAIIKLLYRPDDRQRA